MDKNFYVYEHIRLDNMTCFYVGKGRDYRAYDKRRNEHHNKIANKHGYIVVIVTDNLSEKEAHLLEKELIDQYVFEFGYGINIRGYRNYEDDCYLTNATWGGEGQSGSNSGVDNWQAKRIICLNTKEIFMTITDACEKYKLYPPNVIGCCKHKYKHSGILNNENLVWMYYDEYTNIAKKEVEKFLNNGAKKKGHQSHKIICTTLSKVFDSIEEAKDFCGMKSGSSIGSCCKGKRPIAGSYNGEKLKWMYYDEYKKCL